MILACVMALALAAPAFAVDPVTISEAGGSNLGENATKITIAAAPAEFSVTVPTSFPISVAANGEVTCSASGTAKIVNESDGMVQVSSVEVAGAGGWTLKDYDATDYRAEKVNSNKIGFQIEAPKGSQGDALQVQTGDANNSFDTNLVIDEDGEAALSYSAKVTPLSVPINASTTVATVVFTVGWYSEP